MSQKTRTIFTILLTTIVLGTAGYLWQGQKKTIDQQTTDTLNNQPNQISFQQENQIDSTSEETVDTTTPVSEKAIGFIKQVYTKNGKNYLDIDYVQWLTEKDCEEKNLECNANGFLILNKNTKIRTFEISQNAKIVGDIYAHLDNQESINGVNLSYADFKNIFDISSNSYSKKSMYWIVVETDIITRIQEQYQP